MKRLYISNGQGFTLIECMVAVSLVSIALLSLAQLMGVAFQQTSAGRFQTMATGLAQERLEALRVQYINELESGVVAADLTAGNHSGPTRTLDAPSGSNMGDINFQTSWTVTVAGIRKTVVVTVQPAAQTGASGSPINLTTVLAP